MFKRLLILLAAIVALSACSEDGGNDLPTAPITGLQAGFTVTVSPPATNDGSCRLRFVGQATGGKAGYAFAWDFGALPPRTDQRVGTLADAVVEFVTTASKVGTGTYGVSLTVTDNERSQSKASGFVEFRCVAGAPTSTFSF